MKHLDEKQRHKVDLRVKSRRRFQPGDEVQVGKSGGDGSHPGTVTAVVSGGYYVAVTIGGHTLKPAFYARMQVHERIVEEEK